MKSKVSVIVGSMLALMITARGPVHAKGSDYTGQDLSAEPVQLPPQIPTNSPPKNLGATWWGAETGTGWRAGHR
jgi:hypothetical protein